MKRPSLLLLAASLSVVGALAACGSSSDTDGDEARAPGTPSAEAGPEEPAKPGQDAGTRDASTSTSTSTDGTATDASNLDDTFTYDAAGRLVGWKRIASANASNLEVTFAYDTQGRLVRWTREASAVASDREETFAYDDAGRLVRWARDANAVASNLEETFTYDAQGQPTGTDATGNVPAGAVLNACP